MKKLQIAGVGLLLIALGWIFSGCGKPVASLVPTGTGVAGDNVVQFRVQGTGTARVQLTDGYGDFVDLGEQALPYSGGGPYNAGTKVELCVDADSPTSTATDVGIYSQGTRVAGIKPYGCASATVGQ